MFKESTPEFGAIFLGPNIYIFKVELEKHALENLLRKRQSRNTHWLKILNSQEKLKGINTLTV